VDKEEEPHTKARRHKGRPDKASNYASFLGVFVPLCEVFGRKCRE